MILKPLPFDKTLRWIYYEYKNKNSIFSIPEKKFYKGTENFSVKLHGRPASNPLGPAAGPHTQMTQNIVMGYLAGLRIFELKTVQILDELEISRPCIDARSVVFNVEWSQELKINESLREYVKAYMILEILRQEKIVDGDFIFDVSIGYDYKGITSEKMVDFVQALKNAADIIDELRTQIPEEFSKYRDYNFNPDIANGITLSTFHGCPKDEIERISEFILKHHRMNVIVKLNPTQLPKEELEWLLYDVLHFRHLKINPKAFEVALSLKEAVGMLKKLDGVAKEVGLNAGYKLTNTLEVLNSDTYFNPKEKVMYLSAQPLYVIAMYLAGKMRDELPYMTASFSAGIDRFNFYKAVLSGFTPITVCSDLLRVGGYTRAVYYLKTLSEEFERNGVSNIEEYIKKLGNSEDLHTAAKNNLKKYVEEALLDDRYKYEKNNSYPKRINSTLWEFDCITCDKCIPVCPNAANFTYVIEPQRIEYKNIYVENERINYVEGGVVEIKKPHQIANFLDFCNECGNCDTFCPEYGGPFIKKPGFYSSLEDFLKYKRDGLFLDVNKNTIYGRFKGKVYRLIVDDDIFESDDFRVDLKNNKAESKTTLIDMKYYWYLKLIYSGVRNTPVYIL